MAVAESRLIAEQVPSQGSPTKSPPVISTPDAMLLQNTTCAAAPAR